MAAPLTVQPRDIARPHIVDQLILERAEGLRSNHKAWALVRALAYPVLGYRKAVRMADQIAPMEGRMTINWMSTTLRLRVSAHDMPDIPSTGPLVVVANHPGGVADGLAVWDALVERRPDMMFFANRDALRVSPKLDSMIVPVEWREDARSRARNRETLRSASQAFRDEKAVVMFPAGRIAQWNWQDWRLRDPEWAPTPVAMARKYGAPILPVGVTARMSILYYALAQVSEELKNMTLFHELLRARGARYRLRFGELVDPHDLPADPTAAARRLRLTCEALSARF
ncbi:MAG: 1-acyl-sn-glycerol-3-phosphate acyltransferase [Caulobacterales bacterium]|nr:1-acyl-sn-glycerol-3-phosphate acyltransferase [Caulobacterales bacterium]